MPNISNNFLGTAPPDPCSEIAKLENNLNGTLKSHFLHLFKPMNQGRESKYSDQAPQGDPRSLRKLSKF